MSEKYELTVITGMNERQSLRVKECWHEYLPDVELKIYEGGEDDAYRFRATIKIKRDESHIGLILLGRLLRGVEHRSF